jgi:CubicO group peptidase (beta-lactamase class C family)
MNNRKRIISALLLAVFLFFTACDTNVVIPPIEEEPPPLASLEQYTPSQVEYDYALLPNDEDVDDIEGETGDISLEEFVATSLEAHNDRIRGLALVVFSRDDIILELQYGYADVEVGHAIDSDTVFEWASVAKLLVYVSAMQLYERGELDFHTDIFSYIPAEAFSNIVYPITMHHLIHHSAGLSDLAVPFYLSGAMIPIGEDVPELGDYLNSIFTGAEIQVTHPGERVEYSNYGIALAGYVIERISGMPFYEYVHKNIFAPLGIYHTALRPDLSDNMWVDEQRDAIRVYNQWGLSHVQRSQFAFYPAGSAVGTISDMVKFARALIPDGKGGSVLFENQETLVKFYPTIEEIQYTGGYIFYGFRFFNGFIIFPTSNESSRVLGHGGIGGGFSSRLLIDIDSGVGMVLSENMHDGLQAVGAFINGLQEVVFG